MIDLISEFFRTMAENHPKWNFIFFYEERQWDRVISGLYVTLQLSVVCVLFSVIIGFVGALAQSSPIAAVRWLVNGYIQLLFFYFALGQFTPTVTGADGWTEQPIISNIGWAIISLSFFAGAFNVEIFRAGIESVPKSTQEAAEALGFSRLQVYTNITFPLALRVSLPALNNNLINLVKTTTQAIAIAVPELLYEMVSIWNDYSSAQNAAMTVLFFTYIALVGVVAFGMNTWERKLAVPGFGKNS